MNRPRHILAWALLGLLVVVGAGAAALGVSQAPTNDPLLIASVNTLSAANYTEVIVQQAQNRTENGHFVFQNGRVIHRAGKTVVRTPDRLGGYVQVGDNRTYIYVIGTTAYQSVTAPAGTPVNRLTFFRQNSQSAVQLDPAHGYLPYATQAKRPSQSGSTYTFSLTKNGQTGIFTYVVDGQYISQFTLAVPSVTVRLDISDVGTSPPVNLPAGTRVVGGATGGALG